MNKHQNNIHVSAKTVPHSRTYIILYLNELGFIYLRTTTLTSQYQ